MKYSHSSPDSSLSVLCGMRSSRGRRSHGGSVAETRGRRTDVGFSGARGSRRRRRRAPCGVGRVVIMADRRAGHRRPSGRWPSRTRPRRSRDDRPTPRDRHDAAQVDAVAYGRRRRTDLDHRVVAPGSGRPGRRRGRPAGGRPCHRPTPMASGPAVPGRPDRAGPCPGDEHADVRDDPGSATSRREPPLRHQAMAKTPWKRPPSRTRVPGRRAPRHGRDRPPGG